MSWSNEGGNIFDETLGEATLMTPEVTKHKMRWSGPVVPPASLAFDKVGIEMLSLLPYVAYLAPLHGAQYCEIHVLGPGLVGCAEWIDAILQGLVQCRDLLAKFIPCHEFGAGAVRPYVAVQAFSSDHPYAMSNTRPIQFIQFGTELIIYQMRDLTWWYKELSGSDFSQTRPFPGLEERRAYGPFATPEDAGRDAAERLELPKGIIQAGASVAAPANEMERAEMGLREGLLLRRNADAAREQPKR